MIQTEVELHDAEVVSCDSQVVLLVSTVLSCVGKRLQHIIRTNPVRNWRLCDVVAWCVLARSDWAGRGAQRGRGVRDVPPPLFKRDRLDGRRCHTWDERGLGKKFLETLNPFKEVNSHSTRHGTGALWH